MPGTSYTSKELARWALLGDPHAIVPITLQEMVDRIRRAINMAMEQPVPPDFVPERKA